MELFERPRSGERAVLVHIGQTPADADQLTEFEDLARSAGAEVCDFVSGTRKQPDPRHFIGLGKVEEIAELMAAHEADLAIFDHELSPSQERNLEKALSCRVLDRSGLILDIFAQRARSFEGKLQVELAQLRHLSTRLVRGWTHLERQKGGIGLRGPGETQLETDRRLIGVRINQLRTRLARVDRQRGQSRRARSRADLPTVSLVGYTNAGKSTLFNRLTDASVYAQDQLFATLDPTLRRVELSNQSAFVLADTVGFVSRLPHELVAAFRSTLQETVEASLLLHVVDAASTRRDEQISEVEQVLAEIGADEVPRIEVFNKIDCMDEREPRVDYDDQGRPVRVWLSAQTGAGIDELLGALEQVLGTDRVRRQLHLSPGEARLRALCHEQGSVLNERCLEDGSWELEMEFPGKVYSRLRKHEPSLAAAER